MCAKKSAKVVVNTTVRDADLFSFFCVNLIPENVSISNCCRTGGNRQLDGSRSARRFQIRSINAYHHSSMSVFKIIPTTQEYDWGKTGKNSKVAQLTTAAGLPGFELDEKTSYAEVGHIFWSMPVSKSEAVWPLDSYGWVPIRNHLLCSRKTVVNSQIT